MKTVKLIIIAVCICFGVIACSDDAAKNLAYDANADPKPLKYPPAVIDEFALGQKVYEQNCIFCHQAGGTGGKIEFNGKSLDVDDLTDEKRKSLTDEKIIGYVISGVPDKGMPSFKQKLSEGEMRDVVVYIRKALQNK